MQSEEIIKAAHYLISKNAEFLKRIPKNVSSFYECVDVVSTYIECFVRARIVKMMCEESLESEENPQLRAQLAYLVESSTGHINNLKFAYVRFKDSLLGMLPEKEKKIIQHMDQMLLSEMF